MKPGQKMKASVIISPYSKTSLVKGRGNGQKFLYSDFYSPKREPRALQVLCETAPLPAGTHACYTKALSSGILEMEPDGNLERNTSPRQKTHDPVLFHQFHTLPALQASLHFGTKSAASPVQKVAGGSWGIPKEYSPFSVSSLSQCSTLLGWFSEGPSWLTGNFRGLTLSYDLTWRTYILSLPTALPEERPIFGHRLKHMLMDDMSTNLTNALWA